MRIASLKYGLIFIALWFFSAAGSAQTDVDSLRKQLDEVQFNGRDANETVDYWTFRIYRYNENNQGHKGFKIGLEMLAFVEQTAIAPGNVIHFYHRFAKSMALLGANDLASKFTFRLISISENNHQSIRDISTHIADHANTHFYAANYDSAYFYFKYAQEYDSSKNTSEVWNAHGVLNNMGLCKMKLAEYDEAVQLFKRSLELQDKSNPDDIFHYIIKGNIAEVEMLRGNTELALELYQEIYEDIKRGGPWKIIPQASIMIDLKVELDQLNGIPQLIKDIDSSFIVGDPMLSYQHHLAYYKVAAKYYTASGQSQKATHFLQKELHLMDSIGNFRETIVNEVTEIQTQALLDAYRKQYESEKENLKQEKDLAQLEKEKSEAERFQIIYIAIGIITAILLLILYAFNRLSHQKTKRILSEEQLAREQLEKEKLTQKLSFKEQDIQEFALYLKTNERITGQMIDSLRSILKSDDDSTQQIKELIFQLSNQRQTEEKFEVLKQNVSDVNNEFITRLRKDHPQLSDQERELCMLLALRFNNQEIATLRNVEPGTIRVSLHRLRKKMDALDNENLREILSKYIKEPNSTD